MAFNDIGRELRRQTASFTDEFFKIGSSLNSNAISDEDAIKNGYLCSAVVYTIIKRISTGVSTLPVELYDKATGEEITSGEAYDFVFSPNKDQSFIEFWEQLSTFYALTGECYIYNDVNSIGFMGGRQLVLPPQSMEIKTTSQSIISEISSYHFNDGIASKPLLPDSVMHVAMNNPSIDGLQTRNGLSPLQAAQNLLNASNNIEVALSEYFENRGVSALVSGGGSDGQSLKPSDQSFLQKALNRVIGGAHKSNRMHVISSPVNVQQLNASSTDMQTIENKTQLIRELSAIWGFPSVLVNDNASATYNNIKEAKKEAATEVFIPMFSKIASSYDRQFLSKFGNFGLRVNKSEIEALNPSPTERRKEAREDVKEGIITPNEARLEIGLEEIATTEMNTATRGRSNARQS